MEAKCVRCGKLIKDNEQVTFVQAARIEQLPWTPEDGIKTVLKGTYRQAVHTEHLWQPASTVAKPEPILDYDRYDRYIADVYHRSTVTDDAKTVLLQEAPKPRMSLAMSMIPVWVVGSVIVGFAVGVGLGMLF